MTIVSYSVGLDPNCISVYNLPGLNNLRLISLSLHLIPKWLTQRTVHKQTCHVMISPFSPTCSSGVLQSRALPGQCLHYHSNGHRPFPYWLLKNYGLQYCHIIWGVLDLNTDKGPMLEHKHLPAPPLIKLWLKTRIAIMVFVLTDEEISSAYQHLSYLSLSPALWSMGSRPAL